MRTTKGYEGKEIIKAKDKEVQEILKQGTPQQIIKFYLELRKAWHYQVRKIQGNKAAEQAESLKMKVQELLEKAGWEAHIVNTYQKEKTFSYLHNASSENLQVHEVSFSQEHNITLETGELFDSQGYLRTKADTLEHLKGRIGETEICLNGMLYELTQLGKISEKDRKVIIKIMEEEGLEYLHEVNGQEFRCGSRSFRWFDNEEEAIQEARNDLEDGDSWRLAVSACKETRGLNEWIECVLGVDGWGSVLSSYDGEGRWAGDIPYIRTN